MQWRVLSRASRVVSAALAAGLCMASPSVYAYGVLGHLALVDAVWDDTFAPMLNARYPGLTQDDLGHAHAAAYGGALIHDAGYCPGGSRELGDLFHYVRSGDFVVALADEATNPMEYAFALGALSHYLADAQGHPRGVNRVVPLTFPKLRNRYGDSVTYIQDPKAHLRVEFGFDVVQVARGLYAPADYRRFIGFDVRLPLIYRAVRRTYGIELDDILPRPERSVRSLRHFVATLLPKATRVAWAAKKDTIRELMPDADQEFVYNMNNAAFEREWGSEYDRPGLLSRIGAFLLRLLPKIGRLKLLVPRPPTPDGERIYEESFNGVLDSYRAAIRGDAHPVPNVNLDVGGPVPVGGYARADEAWSKLCARLASAAHVVDQPLADAILAHYGDAAAVCLARLAVKP